MELVHDDASAEQYERCAGVFQRMVEAGTSYEDIAKGCEREARAAEAVGNLERVEDALLIGKWATHRAGIQQDAIEQGHQISNRMAGERQRRRDMKEASLDVLEAMRERDGGKIRVRPSHDELQQRRYGPNWRNRVGRRPEGPSLA